MYASDDLTLIAQENVRNVSRQLVFKIGILRTTCLTSILFLFLSLALNQNATSQHPFLGKEFVTTYQRLQAPWAQDITTTAEDACRVVSTAYKVNIWIDMDIPRDRTVALSKDLETLSDMLEHLAQKLDAQLVILDGLVMITPSSRAEQIAARYWRNKSTPQGTLWSKPTTAPMTWRVGEDAKRIASQLNQALQLDGGWIDTIEPDLWPERRFERESVLVMATCILSSLHLEIDTTEKPLSIKPISESTFTNNQVEWTYTADQLKKLGDEHCKSWKRDHPDALIKNQNRTWAISATPSEHLKLVAPLIPKVKYTKPSTENAIYQGELRGTLGNALDAIGKTMQLQFEPWPLPDAVAKREIKVNYDRATIDDILSELGKAGNVQIQRTGNQCTIKILD